MAEGLLLMSVQERDRSHVVRLAAEHRLSQQEGAERLGIGVRQFKRLVRAWHQDGAAGLVSLQRGRASPAGMPAAPLRESDPDALAPSRPWGFWPDSRGGGVVVELADGITVSQETNTPTRDSRTPALEAEAAESKAGVSDAGAASPVWRVGSDRW